MSTNNINNAPITCIWAVSKNGLVPPRKYNVLKEGAKCIVLEDGTLVRKCTMENTYQLFYADEESADETYRWLRKVFDNTYAEPKTNFDQIKDASVSGLSNILLNMIFELCEECVPTKEDIEDWLKSPVEKVEE